MSIRRQPATHRGRAFSNIARLAAGIALGLAASEASAADANHPTVIELFQSQGCSSCPPANANLNALSQRPDLIALSFSVTYWDSLGWKDTFAKEQFTNRQYAYAHAMPGGNVYTPQIVINGRLAGVGAERGEMEALIRKGERAATGPAIAIAGGAAEIGAATAPATPADVWLVRYEPRTIEVAVLRGENAGKTLAHRNIVRELVRLGSWSGATERFALPAAADPGLATAVLVQAPGTGPILAAAKG
jgi:hypothetical protein